MFFLISVLLCDRHIPILEFFADEKAESSFIVSGAPILYRIVKRRQNFPRPRNEVCLFLEHKDVSMRSMQRLIVFALFCLGTESVMAAVPSKYQVNMRIGMKGQLPISISTPVKSGKKASFTEISSDGQSETMVELVSRRSKVNAKDGLWMDVKVTRTVRGQKKAEERTQIFAYENQEAEFSKGGRRGKNPDFSIAVMAHSI